MHRTHMLRADAPLLLVAALCVGPLAWLPAGSEADCHEGHAAHGQDPSGEYVRRVEDYDVPDVTLVDPRGKRVSLASVIGSEKPVMLNFIFTSCTTICPVMSATFASVQQKLGEERQDLQMVSISIDPAHDTPERLADYAERLRARDPWEFLTGEPASVRKVQEAFRAYRGNKMNHVPLTFLRASRGTAWVRLQGFASAADLVREYRGLVGH